jgi:hypothetical protein
MDDVCKGQDILQFMLSLVLDGTCINMNSLEYYRGLAAHVRARDPETLARVEEFVEGVRTTYRSSREHATRAAMVPVTRQEEAGVREALDNDCAICLQALRGSRKLVRLRPLSGRRGACGHFFHAQCVAGWELRDLSLAPKTCPLCREPLGLVARFWEDQESVLPEF